MKLVGITWRFPKVAELFKAREQEILMFVAAQLQTNRGEMFDSENSGRTPWEKPKLRQGQALSMTGTLRKSFAPHNDGERPVVAPDGIVRFSGETITIGTKIAYANILNNGGIIRAKNYPVLWIPLPDGSAKSSNAPSKFTKDAKRAAKNRSRLPGMEKTMARLHARYKKDPSPENAEAIREHRKKMGDVSKDSDGPPIVKGRDGKYYMLAKQVTIPKRPMDEWNQADQNELQLALRDKLESVLQEIFNG